MPRSGAEARAAITPLRVTQTEISGQSLGPPNASKIRSSKQNSSNEKADTSAQKGNQSEESTRNAVLTVQNPATTLSWLPNFEWTDEDESALNKFENDIDAFPDIPESEVKNLPGNGVANTDTAETSKDQRAHDRLESRKKLEALLSASLKSAGGGALKRPRWRLDVEADNKDVSHFIEDPGVMEPLQVFRSAVLTVLHTIYLKNMLMDKKLAEKESATRGFESMLRVFFDATRLWLGKVVRTPLLSLLQDSTLDVDISARRRLAGSSLRGFAKKFGGILSRRSRPSNDLSSESSVDPVKLLKLKVRMKGILQALNKAVDKKEVPSGMLDFWKRISTDGVYFPPSYQLFIEERQYLEFDDLGATRRMEFEGSILTDVKDKRSDDEAAPQDAKCFSRFNIVMVNFLFVRILIPHVILQPWSVGIGPKNNGKQASANLASLATLCYCVCRQLSPLPPPVERSEASFLGRRRSKVLVPVFSRPNASDESPTHSSESHPQEEVNPADISFLSIEDVGRHLISDRLFPCDDAQVIQVVKEHHSTLLETMTHLRFQLHGSQVDTGNK
ncbi:hypothetical protein P3T76_000205 [Phytophthora citrophthora]|uniref:Uncharacterized protein n=1 Tax=Phytophthora citrophthora TaxID=4793 RepID=A0AAD9LS60_9STRA|nr:hypothetical protein P3T76_000205 [Phytophthora citrophthora]